MFKPFYRAGSGGLDELLKRFPLSFFIPPSAHFLRIFRGAHLLGLRTFLNGQPIQFNAYFLLHFVRNVGVNP